MEFIYLLVAILGIVVLWAIITKMNHNSKNKALSYVQAQPEMPSNSREYQKI